MRNKCSYKFLLVIWVIAAALPGQSFAQTLTGISEPKQPPHPKQSVEITAAKPLSKDDLSWVDLFNGTVQVGTMLCDSTTNKIYSTLTTREKGGAKPGLYLFRTGDKCETVARAAINLKPGNKMKIDLGTATSAFIQKAQVQASAPK